MTTSIEMLRNLERVLPGSLNYGRRRVVRLVAEQGGIMAVESIRLALGSHTQAYLDECYGWDGLRRSFQSGQKVIILAPWLRKALGMPVETRELLSDLNEESTLAAGLNRTLDATADQVARQQGYDGPPCPYCHERRTVSAGDQHACDACGMRWRDSLPPSKSRDRFADVRAAVARATNVSTVQEGLAYAYGAEIVQVQEFVPPRDCPGVAL